MKSSARAQQILFDAVPFNARIGEVQLAPGSLHRIEVVWPSMDVTGAPLKILFRLKSPGGNDLRREQVITSTSPRAAFELGPLAAPPEFVFEAGEVFQQGYQLSVTVSDGTGRSVRKWEFQQAQATGACEEQQGMGERDPPVQMIRLVIDQTNPVVYNPAYGSLGLLSLRLGERVLVDQDTLEIQARLNAGEAPEVLGCVILVTGASGEQWRKRVELKRGGGWKSILIDAARWSSGEFRVELLPEIGGTVWPDGPRLRYLRHAGIDHNVPLCPVAPWRLERDPERSEVTILDFRAATQAGERAAPAHWRWVETRPGQVGAASDGEFTARPLVLHPHVRGFHAVFAVFNGSGGLIQVGRKGWIRGVSCSRLTPELFVEAADLTDEEIRLFPSRDPGSTLVSLKLVPVTADSVREMARTLRQSPLPLLAVNDWAEYFGTKWSRLLPDQFAFIVGAESECGFHTVGWSVGRSWVEYPSKLPQAKLFPCVSYEEAKKSPHYPADPYDYGPRIIMMNQFDSLAAAYAAGGEAQAQIWPWLAMQRHYGENSYGGIFCCPFYRAHPEWRQIGKDGAAAGLSFYYPEVRRERVDILMEVAERGADGLLIGCDRQVPMLRYEPAMVKEFRDKTGIDPLSIDVSAGEPFVRWIRFRAGFFTDTLRELKRRLDPLRAKRGVRIPVGVRMPSGGLVLNLAQGLDVETWCREGLVDLIDLDPLEECSGEGSHDVRPYIHLAHQYGVRVFGGIGSTAFRDLRDFGIHDWNFSVVTAGLKRARGLHRAGVEGISVFETEVLAWTDPLRFLVALYGHPDRLEQFLDHSNIEAVYPVDAGNAAAGHDNHSVWRKKTTWTMSGFGGKSL